MKEDQSLIGLMVNRLNGQIGFCDRQTDRQTFDSRVALRLKKCYDVLKFASIDQPLPQFYFPFLIAHAL